MLTKSYGYEKIFGNGSGQAQAQDSNSNPISYSKGDIRRKKREEDDRERAWEFGGLSARYTHGSDHDGRDSEGREESENTPICKHLLACLLAEKWDVLVGFVREKRCAGREEAAGLVVEC